MVEGESGLLSVLPSSAVKSWNRALQSLELELVNGCMLTGFSSEIPGALKGPQHHRAWCDELAAWIYPRETWDMLMFGMRLPNAHPQVVVTTTPLPIPLVVELHDAPGTVLTTGSTYENIDNLAPSLRTQILSRYEGTSLGRQEIYGEILTDIDGALWHRTMIANNVIGHAPSDLTRIVVAIDPAGGTGEENDETGIVVCGRDSDGHGYVLADLSGKYSPPQWAKRAIAAYDKFKADRIVAEVNYGGQMVEHTIRTVRKGVPVTVVTASRGKRQRAEPIAALYEQGRVHHVGTFPKLEDQLCSWLPDSKKSPDRMDALVWAMSNLFDGMQTIDDYLAQIDDKPVTEEAPHELKPVEREPEVVAERKFQSLSDYFADDVI